MLRRLTSLQVLNTMQFYERVVFAIAHVLFQPVFPTIEEIKSWSTHKKNRLYAKLNRLRKKKFCHAGAHLLSLHSCVRHTLPPT